MTENYVKTDKLDHEAWLKERQKGIGGSDVSAILGVNPYKTQYQLWKEKVDQDVPQAENEAMHFGLVLEDVIAEEYCLRTGHKVRRDNKIRFHPDYPFLLANIDRTIVGNGKGPGILEIKTASSFAYKTWETDIPISYYCQLQHYLSVTGYSWGDFAVLIDGRQFGIIAVVRDDEYIQKQNQALSLFWEKYVIKNVPPPLTAAEYNFVQTRASAAKEASEEMFELYQELLKIKQEKKTIEQNEDIVKDRIKIYLAEDEILTYKGDILATWKSQTKTSLDTKKIKAEMPEIYDKYGKESVSRTFLLKELKNE